MEFKNEFTVRAPLDRVWDVLTDVNQVAPCVPGAQITETLGENRFKGVVKVKLGAVSVSYRGEMEMLADESARTIVLQGKGSEARGSGGATGTMTVQLSQSGEDVEVSITSQVDVTGRIATFGRGIMQDVANRLIKEFATCVQAKIEAGGESPSSSGETPASDAASNPGGPATNESGEGSFERPATATPPAPAPAQPPAQSSSQVGEVNLSHLLGDLVRARIAEGLRSLASRIEPR